MSEYTYNIGSDAGKVRLLISDVGGRDGRSFLFADEEIGVFLTLAEGPLYASALALRAIAGNEAQVSKRVKFLDLETDGPAVAKSLLELADRYEKSAEENMEVEIASMDLDAFSRRELRGIT